ncbi:MAG TPA: endonuclease/exonuclease/phosphatase family protein [Candidatus Dormibacteraeota bacterium]|jgi:endonuclease/exonuclease/phosphatase family metal-dependent hydrolase|nr:endonuclease/exonuclease/phosphatase family protein [Candidatus Dormibacteraeota bacterium]
MPDTPAQLRVVTYNILLGGQGRGDRIAAILERANADVIALQEASDLDLVRSLADRLGMRMIVAKPNDASKLNLAVLSRVPVTRWRAHRHPGRMLRAHLECEIAPNAPGLPRLRIHCIHLAARFGEKNKGEARRLRELEAILGDIERSGSTPHLLLGDFNSLAPGEPVAATAFFTRMAQLRRRGLLVRGLDGIVAPLESPEGDEALDEAWRKAGVAPHLQAGVPRLPWVVGPLTGLVPRSTSLDRVLNRFIERWTVPRVAAAGYVDCYRSLHNGELGYTCATWSPVARIDYVFADEPMAGRLLRCEVIGGDAHPDPDVLAASDHYPVLADFRL